MSNGVQYLLTGQGAAVRLVCSIWSLRKHYDGPVQVCVAEQSRHIGCCLTADKRLGVDVTFIGRAKQRVNSTYVLKAAIWKLSPFESTIFLDADTTVHGTIGELFGHELALTQFSNWTTNEERIRKRILRLVKAHDERVMRCMFDVFPAVNTGIYAWSRGAEPKLEEWERTTAPHRIFMADELTMQILAPEFEPTWFDDRYNFSAIYGCNKHDIHIRHYHGKKHTRPVALEAWGPVYDECLREDVAGIRGWTPAGDKRLAAWLEERNCQPSKS